MVRALDNMYDIIDSNLIAINIPEKKYHQFHYVKKALTIFPIFEIFSGFFVSMTDVSCLFVPLLWKSPKSFQ